MLDVAQALYIHMYCTTLTLLHTVCTVCTRSTLENIAAVLHVYTQKEDVVSETFNNLALKLLLLLLLVSLSLFLSSFSSKALSCEKNRERKKN